MSSRHGRPAELLRGPGCGGSGLPKPLSPGPFRPWGSSAGVTHRGHTSALEPGFQACLGGERELPPRPACRATQGPGCGGLGLPKPLPPVLFDRLLFFKGTPRAQRPARAPHCAAGAREGPADGCFVFLPWMVCSVRRSTEAAARAVDIASAGKFFNDPSAGSPTETLLRLLLPLNDQVWTSFRLVMAGPTAPPREVSAERNPVQDRQSEGLTKSFNR